VRIGIAHHLGWAVAVTATDDHDVVDRRRIELIGPDLPNAPIEPESKGLSDTDLAALMRRVRASVVRITKASLDDLAADLGAPIRSISLRSWPPDFPTDLATLRRAPYDSRADSILYLQVLADVAHERGWAVHLYDAKQVEQQAVAALGGPSHADDVLHGPRKRLGPPWAKDHRMALAATVLAGDD
jgi:hypothetical protein